LFFDAFFFILPNSEEHILRKIEATVKEAKQKMAKGDKKGMLLLPAGRAKRKNMNMVPYCIFVFNSLSNFCFFYALCIC
jgi:hypothetical protein